MIESMTGFGRGTAVTGGKQVTVELRSVNNRFCEISLRVPRSLNAREGDMQQIIRTALVRGKINVNVTVQGAEEGAAPVTVNEEAARRAYAMLDSLRRAVGITDPIRLEHLTGLPDLFQPEEEGDTGVEDPLYEATRIALQEAIEGLRAMRRQEGEALCRDLSERIESIAENLVLIEARAPERIEEARKRLYDRLNEILGDERLNRDRIEQEIVMLADRLDITEEGVRLRSHLNLFREALSGTEAAGRKLNFLLQEINREVNTIGSKANDAEIAQRAVVMKEELEKIREQVQNLE